VVRNKFFLGDAAFEGEPRRLGADEVQAPEVEVSMIGRGSSTG